MLIIFCVRDQNCPNLDYKMQDMSIILKTKVLVVAQQCLCHTGNGMSVEELGKV